jgi:hypothetical protein
MKRKKAKRLTQRQIEKSLDEIWQEQLQRSGLVTSPSQAKKLIKEVKSLERSVGILRGIEFGMALEMRNWGKDLAKKRHIKDEQKLAKAIEDLRRVGGEMPTLIRKATKELMGRLPRRGGPGAQRKLNEKDAALACDHVMGP